MPDDLGDLPRFSPRPAPAKPPTEIMPAIRPEDVFRDPTPIIQGSVIGSISAAALVIAARASGVVVIDEESKAEAGRMAAEIRRASADLEKSRKLWTDPLNGWVKRITGLFAPAREALVGADQHLTKSLVEYRSLERLRAEEEARRQREVREAALRAQQEELQRLAEAERARNVSPDDPGSLARSAMLASESIEQQLLDLAEIEPVPAPIGNIEGMSVRKTWTFDVIDLAKVPREWLILNEMKIRQAITRQANPTREIPGILIYQEESLSRRAESRRREMAIPELQDIPF